MAIMAWLHFLPFFLVNFARSNDVPEKTWREEYYQGMPIDHFSYPEHFNNTYDLRYLINDQWWDAKGGPIFLYTGNEGKIEDFAESTGLMWDWAPEFKSMLVFAEHRYYGKSLPYGNLSFENPYLQHLSVDQAMADFATLIAWLKSNITGASASPVITFGGSYGAMLASWTRVKYPNLVVGAIASGAPIMQLNNEFRPCWTYSSATTRIFSQTHAGCEKAIKKIPASLEKLAETADGVQWVNENFRICQAEYEFQNESMAYLVFSINQIWSYMAMASYPYPTEIFQPLPAWPVKEACSILTSPSTDTKSFLSNVAKVVLRYYNGTGELTCFSLDTPAIISTKTENIAWGFQTCTDLLINMRCNRDVDMFRANNFSSSFFSKACYNTYGVRPKWDWLIMNYGLERIKFASNIIFVNNELDPWIGASITEDELKGADLSLMIINVHQGGHHYDLLGNHPGDTQEILEIRNRMKGVVQNWIRSDTLKMHSLPAPLLAPIQITPAPIDISQSNNGLTPNIALLQGLGVPEVEGTPATTSSMQIPEANSSMTHDQFQYAGQHA